MAGAQIRLGPEAVHMGPCTRAGLARVGHDPLEHRRCVDSTRDCAPEIAGGKGFALCVVEPRAPERRGADHLEIRIVLPFEDQFWRHWARHAVCLIRFEGSEHHRRVLDHDLVLQRQRTAPVIRVCVTAVALVGLMVDEFVGPAADADLSELPGLFDVLPLRCQE
ncbi:MAG: hypothetical protein AAGI50_00800 [Pseudomonadota bacterium]